MEKHIRFVLLCVALFAGLGCAQNVGDALYVGSQLQLNLNAGGSSYVPTGGVGYANIPNLNWGGLSTVTLELRFWARTSSSTSTLFFYGNDTNYLWIGIAGNNPVSYMVILQDGTRQTQSLPRSNSQQGAWNYLSLSISQSQIAFYTTSWLDTSTSPSTPDTTNTTFGANLTRLAQASGGTGVIGYIPYSNALANVSSDSLLTYTFIGLPGLVDEIRVYSFNRSSSQVDSDKTTSFFNGTGLLALYTFENDVDGSLTFTDSISGQFGTLINGGSVRNPAITSSQTTATPIVTQAIRKAVYNGATSLPLRVYKYINSEGVSNPLANSNTVTMCLDNGASCTSLPTTIASSSLGTYFTVSVIPQRLSCGKLMTTYVSLDSGVFNFSIYYGSFTPSFTDTAISFNSTSGGVENLSGFFGDYKDQTGSSFTQTLDGAVEKALMVYNLPASGIDNLTSSVSISASGTSLQVSFTDTGKYGTGNLQVTLCNQVISIPVAYPAPVVTNVDYNSYDTFVLSGANFGSSRTWTGDISSVAVVQSDGTVRNCTVGSNTDTSISCTTATKLLFNLTTTFTVRVGDQNATLLIPQFDPCHGNCHNGGGCSANGTVALCDCTQTLYEGDYCNTSLSCFPLCQHGGSCVRDPSNSTIHICDCSQTGYSGSFCEQKSKSSSGVSTALIAGVTAGGGALLLILIAAVVVLFLKRNKPRGGKNFIPLEKKDFTKIIYGEQLDQEPDKTEADISKLENMLTEDNLEIAAAISNMTQITEADKIAKALVVVFQAHDKVLTLLKAFIAEEVNTTESAGTLFRSNSMVSKMFKFYSRLIGLPYLYITIGPEVCELIEENLGLEVDPEKMEEGTDLDEMRWMLMAQSQKILKSILRSIEDCPPQFRILFNHIKTCVAERFPENINTTIGGFIFLRFFCPAISSPEAYGIIDEPPTPQARRLLILITKVLQNLSNDVEFGSKEPYMTKMNDFIHSNRDKLSEFYEKLIKPSAENPTECHLPKNMKSVSLAVIANHIQDNINKVEDDKVKARLQSIFS